ncbi:hypothetical protein Goklo_003984, partial [Gossypium klotzschianum]|nr:hypothetical protein [Gossypium klotzschianum]
MGVTPKIAPSMLSSDFANLASEAKRMLDFGADWLHMDIMVNFVYNFASFLDSQEKRNDFQHSNFFCFLGFFLQDGAFLDCHLMVTNPIDYVEPLGKAGASGFTFHVEVSKENWQELIPKIKSKAMRPGVALKPGTLIEEVYPL